MGMDMSKQILLVEDTIKIHKSLTFSLEREGYEVVACETAEEALKAVEASEFDLILLDLMLPKMSGEEFLNQLTEKEKIPVIVISALDDEFTQINLYSKKIDDYITKPFSTNILTLKIDAVLRRVEQKTNDILVSYQDIVIEVNNYVTYRKGIKVELTTKEFEILQTMLLNQGKVFSREEFLDSLWGYDVFIDSRTVDVHIKNLRQKLGKELITTVKGIGYRIEKE